MYPSNTNGYYSDHSLLNQDPSLSFFNFPSFYYNQCELDDVFLLHNQTLMPHSVLSDTIINNPAGSGKNEDYRKVTQVQQPPRKRLSSSRDRHSKINTANGLRDRRMRLSLDVAREFFGLQDMLGFNKASRTVEWLLTQARQEIKKLKTRVSVDAKSSYSTSDEAEVVSASEGIITTMEKPTMVEKKVRRNPLARDLREKARARAKARTKAKKLCGETNELNTSLLQATVAEAKEFDSRAIEHMIIEEPMSIINKWSSNPMLNCLQNSGINQEHQLGGFLSFGKPWETYN